MNTTDLVALSRTLHDTHAARIYAEWRALLESEPSEPAVQSFLEQYPMLLPGAKGDIGPGGHHGPIYGGVVREPPLSGVLTNRRPDFMWITKATGLITPICIEIEKPTKRWFTEGGAPHSDFTQAQNQLSQWRGWFKDPDNERWFRRTYLGGEFDRWMIEPQFVLIYGRQSEFDGTAVKIPPAERVKVRREWARENEHLRTFDSLYYAPELESEVAMTVRENGDLQVHKIPPTFTECAYPRGCFLLGDPAAAINRSVPETQERRDEILQLWNDQSHRGRRLSLGLTDKPLAGLSPWGDDLPQDELPALK
jgi:hypothetical protein